MKQRARETHREEKVLMLRNNSDLEHVKRIGVSVGAHVPHASLDWCQDKSIEDGNNKGLKSN